MRMYGSHGQRGGLLRFAAGSLAGALFVPVGLVLHLRARRHDRD